MPRLIRTHRWAVAISSAIALHLVFTFTVFAQVIDPSVDPSALLQLFLAKVQVGNWKAIAALVAIGAVWALRKFGGRYIPFLKTDRGGTLLTLATGITGGLGHALLVDAPITAELLTDGLAVGVTAAGGYVVVKRILWPSDVKKAADAAGAAAAKDPATVEKTLNR